MQAETQPRAACVRMMSVHIPESGVVSWAKLVDGQRRAAAAREPASATDDGGSPAGEAKEPGAASGVDADGPPERGMSRALDFANRPQNRFQHMVQDMERKYATAGPVPPPKPRSKAPKKKRRRVEGDATVEGGGPDVKAGDDGGGGAGAAEGGDEARGEEGGARVDGDASGAGGEGPASGVAEGGGEEESESDSDGSSSDGSWYKMDDGFIDDSELLNELQEGSMDGSEPEVKASGFFISRGALQSAEQLRLEEEARAEEANAAAVGAKRAPAALGAGVPLKQARLGPKERAWSHWKALCCIARQLGMVVEDEEGEGDAYKGGVTMGARFAQLAAAVKATAEVQKVTVKAMRELLGGKVGVELSKVDGFPRLARSLAASLNPAQVAILEGRAPPDTGAPSPGCDVTAAPPTPSSSGFTVSVTTGDEPSMPPLFAPGGSTPGNEPSMPPAGPGNSSPAAAAPAPAPAAVGAATSSAAPAPAGAPAPAPAAAGPVPAADARAVITRMESLRESALAELATVAGADPRLAALKAQQQQQQQQQQLGGADGSSAEGEGRGKDKCRVRLAPNSPTTGALLAIVRASQAPRVVVVALSSRSC